jgi:predicted CopG family antitoxin
LRFYSSRIRIFKSTVYRRLTRLKDGFDSAERRKGRITEREEQILKLFDSSWVPEVEEVGESKIKEETDSA